MARGKQMSTAKKGGAVARVKDVDAQLEAEAAQVSDRISAGENKRISTNDKVFTLPDGRILKGPVDFIIVDFTNANMFYDRPYDPNNPSPPACFAIGKIPGEMVPSDNAPDPQSGDCASCWANEFGSRGNGKACKNSRRLAVMLAEDEPGDGDVFTLDVSPTALKAFDAYVNSLSKIQGKAPVQVITEVDFHPEKTFATLIFGNARPNDDYADHFQRRGEAEILLTAEPDVSEYQPLAAAGKRGGKGAGRGKR